MKTDTADIYDDLQRKLMTAVFKPGEKLKPASLQGDYGVSSNTVRDVLMRLLPSGLVEFEEQRGFRATPSSETRRRDVTRFRIMLEQEGCTLSIQKGGLEWEASLTAAHHKLSHIERQIARDSDLGEHAHVWSDAELGFHTALISACDSPLLMQTFSRVYALFRQQVVGVNRDFGTNYFEAIISEHKDIVDAALARDVGAAREAIYRHMARSL
ncbi:GntR family transcriptional regulator [Shimia biformata]|uniref:GntR family transcriptional regulator n=1 Tax=Shimia biformata TaxID=1294299 RepID=UPI0019500415|nr:GntR family transcriptional regulator [Shimia biformata]